MSELGKFERPALIRGHGHTRICFVTTYKNGTTHDAASRGLFRPPITVLNGEDDFEDGIYELVLGAQVFVLTKNRGKYQEISEPVAVGSGTYRVVSLIRSTFHPCNVADEKASNNNANRGALADRIN